MNPDSTSRRSRLARKDHEIQTLTINDILNPQQKPDFLKVLSTAPIKYHLSIIECERCR